MKKAMARIILFQLVNATKLIEQIAKGEVDGKEAATAYALSSMAGVSKDECDAFFESEEGKQLERGMA